MALQSALLSAHPDYVPAAPDRQLSSSQSPLLAHLLSHEDQLLSQQLLHIHLPSHLHQLLHETSSLLQLSSCTVWMSTLLLKQLLLQQQQQSISLVTALASLTLSSKYQISSLSSHSQSIDYDLLVHHFHLDHIQQIHDAEMDLLDRLSYDISVITPDHFFSYLANLDLSPTHIIDEARSTLLDFGSSSADERLALLHNYPSSIVALSLIFLLTPSDSFIIEQIKSFLQHKHKDPSHYLTQLLHCVAQLQRLTSSL